MAHTLLFAVDENGHELLFAFAFCSPVCSGQLSFGLGHNLTLRDEWSRKKTSNLESAKKCCVVGYRVGYETRASLIEVLNHARAMKAQSLRVKKYCSYELLIIYEFGFEKLERKEVSEAGSLLYKVIDERIFVRRV